MSAHRIAVEKLGSFQGSKGHWVRRHLQDAINRRLQPVLINKSSVESFPVKLSQELADELKKVASSHGLSTAMACAGLVKAAISQQDQEGSPKEEVCSTHYVNAMLVRLVRSELQAWLEQGASQAAKGKISVMEAATGSGKGRAICAAALAHLDAGFKVTISAPLEVVFQIAETLEVFDHPSAQDYSILLGRPNFINERFVLDHALETGNKELAEWVEAGGQPLSERVCRYMQKTGCPLAFLMEDALSLASDLPVRESRLDASDQCEASAVYKKASQYSISQPILLMSHHMLAAGSFIKDAESTFFRKDDQLIIDEAHQFEEALASLSSTTIHANVLPRKFSGYPRAKSAAQAFLDAARETYARQSKTSKKEDQFYFGNYMTFPTLYSCLVDLNFAIKESVKGEQKKRDLKSYIDSLQRLQLDLKNEYSMTRIGATRVKVNPVINSGSYLLSGQLKKIWGNYSGAMLVSATILSGKGEAGLFRWMLQIPEARIFSTRPVTPKWISESLDIKHDFTQSTDFTSDEWVDEVAIKCLEKAAEAQGGMLILNTSYDTCQRLHERLSEKLGDRLVTQGADKGAGECKKRFVELYREGIKPVWIGVGQAWVGVDLTDTLVDAGEDHMLSDLVVPKLPYGANQSMTSQYRKSVGGFSVTAQEGGWLLRQGIGRLVRRQGCPKKNVWLLDKRVKDPAHKVLVRNLDRYLVK